ncbi:SIR2 family protein [Algoriphagus yeomjeoni]|uniref:SIR2-like protein n=1 Tax=Algoriphagus yeomjeoni TaxID=291403 RepID=A0A327PNG1_9BACT|nr:SIR2 family protein [Algoriphagus yeomjeoni]RAI93840.1 SIR2-like protein [Algoriphagus yeomjeoni]
MAMDQSEFIRKIIAKIDKCSWFLGAGFSVSANLPTANQIIWDLKKKYYCSEENQDIHDTDIQIQQIRKKIQEFCDSKGFPKEYDDREYSFYFDLLFGDNEEEQRQYLVEALNSGKITLSIGHRILASLMYAGISKVVYTTNFDKVLENAYSYISNKDLASYHLEGANACKGALNNDEFPLYAKVHGDFQYKKLANLAEHLVEADEEIRKCFLSSASRFGLIVAGYSGRDKSIMDLLNESLSATNAFPQGLYWTTLKNSKVHTKVLELIQSAKSKGIEADIVEVDNFDSLMTRLWRNLPSKPTQLVEKVERISERIVNIPIPKPSKNGQLIRFNSVPITDIPTECFKIEAEPKLDWEVVKDLRKLAKDKAILWIDENVYAWGNLDTIKSAIPGFKKIETTDIAIEISDLNNHKSLQSALEELICGSLCQREELLARKHTIIIGKEHFTSEKLKSLKSAVGQMGGYFPKVKVVNSVGLEESITPIWSYCLNVRIKQIDENYILILSPDIWISPQRTRRNYVDFLRQKRSGLKNDKLDQLLSAWIETIFIEVGNGNTVSLKPYLATGSNGSNNIRTTNRTSYSRKTK